MTQEEFYAFSYEIINWGNIPISSKNCGVGCIFCKVHRDPILKRFPKLPEITMDDLIEGFKFINESHNFVRLGAGVMVAAHTDPFLHPLIYDFIKRASEYFPHKKITTVTTGSYISENKIDYLWSIKNYGIDLSLVTMQEQRELIVPRPTRDRLETILKEAPIRKISLMFTGNLDALKRDLDKLIGLNWHVKAKEILVRRVEYTKFSPEKLNTISYQSIEKYEECINFLKTNYPFIKFTVPHLDELYLNGEENEYFTEGKERLSNIKNRFSKEQTTFFNVVCSASSYKYFGNDLQNFSNVKVHLVENHLYGGSVTIAGLLNHEDIMRDFIPTKAGVVVLPKEMYDHEDKEITGRHISELQTHYKSEIWKA
jgi:hypothetical protein